MYWSYELDRHIIWINADLFVSGLYTSKHAFVFFFFNNAEDKQEWLGLHSRPKLSDVTIFVILKTWVSSSLTAAREDEL